MLKLDADPLLARTAVEDPEALVYERVKAAILQGRLPPGAKLPEELLAETLGVNRARVRSALQRLSFEDLIDLKRNRGAFIAVPDLQETRAVFVARRVVERATTEIVTRTILTPHLNALKRDLVSWEREWMHGQRQRTIEGISSFHRSLAALAHNRPLAVALERLVLQTSLILGRYATSTTFSAAAIEYRALLVLIESGESLAAAKAMDRCLHIIEQELDMRPAPSREVDIRLVFRA